MNHPLVEREGVLHMLRGLTAQLAAGGRIALVAGEAGAGKTSVLRAFAQAHQNAGGALWWGGCDALQSPHPLAPFLDMAREHAPQLSPYLNASRHQLFEAVLEALRRSPQAVLVVVEDAHWADDASLDLLKFLGRRIEHTRALLAISYRDDEVGLTHPLRRVLGELPIARRSNIDIPRLSASGVMLLARQHGRSAEGVFEATRGNAFFATEMLADNANPAGAVPRHVQDLVLARMARLAPRVQALLQAVSVAPGRIDHELLQVLAAPTSAELTEALDCGLLVAEGHTLAYRHELARMAVSSALPEALARELHSRALHALLAPGKATPAARLLHHAVLAHDSAAVARHAVQAAQQAQQRGAHREAAACWQLALEHTPASTDTTQRTLLEQHAVACAAVGRHGDALRSRRELEQLALERQDVADSALQWSAQAALHIADMRHQEASELTQRALQALAPLPEGRAHVQVWRWAAHLSMLERDVGDAATLAAQAADLATRLGDEDAAMDALSTLGTARLFTDFERGRDLLLEAQARQGRAGRMAAQALSLGNLGSGAGELMQLQEAQTRLEQALALCQANELDGQGHYVQAWLAQVALQRGQWDSAATWADGVLSRAAAPISRLAALLVLARLRLRRGDPGADTVLDQALALTGEHNTLQRMAPLRAARAEAAFSKGQMQAVRSEVDAALPHALRKGHRWFSGELAYWGWRAGMAMNDTICSHLAPPYALEISGRWRDAAQAWEHLGCPFEQARVLSLGDATAQQQALVLLQGLGARPGADALRRSLRDAGVRPLERGQRPSTQQHPARLTQAEARVLALMAQGLKNAEMAAALHRSVRTVDHQVAAILAKLEVGSRHEALARARREGWLDGA